MIVITEFTEFEWDSGNKDKNLIRHNVTNQEAEEIFHNKPLPIFPDAVHSTKNEIRYQAIGKTNSGKILFISFTLRQEKVRIISARKADRKEEEIYAKKEKT